jgi:hypothetical protein
MREDIALCWARTDQMNLHALAATLPPRAARRNEDGNISRSWALVKGPGSSPLGQFVSELRGPCGGRRSMTRQRSIS